MLLLEPGASARLAELAAAAQTPAVLLVGPEGGFDPDERAQALASGAVLARVGPYVLRVETAAEAGLAILVGCAR
jgi:16S rRNA (uracil1498-N3)-methyltransferase